MSEVSEINKLVSRSAISETVGGKGGKSYDGPSAIDGPISQIRIYHGKFIDALTITYGNVEYIKIGGGGGIEESLEIAADEVISKVRVWSGKYIDGLCFEIKNKDGQRRWSKHYGRDGGKEKTIDGKGYPLRKITCRAGKYIDQLTFHFGYVVRLENLVFETPSMLKALENTDNVNLEAFASGEEENYTPDPFSTNVEVSESISTETSTTWKAGTEFSVGNKVSGEAVFGIKVKTEWNFQFKATLTFERRNTHKKVNNFKVSRKITTRPGKKTIWKCIVLKGKLENVEFNYDVVVYDPVKDEEIDRVTRTGFLKGTVCSNNYNFKATEVDSNPSLKIIKSNISNGEYRFEGVFLKEDGTSIPNIRLVANLGSDSKLDLGEATTDEEGSFNIHFTDAEFSKGENSLNKELFFDAYIKDKKFWTSKAMHLQA